MQITFEEKYLEELFKTGQCNDKKHRFQPDIVRRYQKAILFLKNASSINSLWQIHSLKYETLKGDKTGMSSVRVNDQYRIEFTVQENIEQPILTICNIVELSNHYK